MSASVSFLATSKVVIERSAKSVLAICLVVGVGACSTKPPSYSHGNPHVYSWSVAGGPRTMSEPPQRVVELEDDGLPVQDAPPARIRNVPDDPSEPFSPNYGGPAPQRATLVHAGTADDGDGYPVPMSPAEAGVRAIPPTVSRNGDRRAGLSQPLQRCIKTGQGWLCAR